jgi:hypothetical protein
MLCERHQQISNPTLANFGEEIGRPLQACDEPKAIRYSTVLPPGLSQLAPRRDRKN